MYGYKWLLIMQDLTLNIRSSRGHVYLFIYNI